MESQWWGGSVCWIHVVWWPASESSSGNTRTMRDTVCKSKMHNTWVTTYILCPPQHDSHVCTLIHICMLHAHRNDWSTSKAYLSKQQKVIRKIESLHGVYFKNPSSFFLIFNFLILHSPQSLTLPPVLPTSITRVFSWKPQIWYCYWPCKSHLSVYRLGCISLLFSIQRSHCSGSCLPKYFTS